jgi:hypothetical protein
MGEQDVAHVEAVLLDQPEEAFIEDPRVDQHRVARFIGPEEVAVGEVQNGEVAEELQG